MLRMSMGQIIGALTAVAGSVGTLWWRLQSQINGKADKTDLKQVADKLFEKHDASSKRVYDKLDDLDRTMTGHREDTVTRLARLETKVDQQ